MDRDTTRRDAIARTLCARICDDRRTVDDLQLIDVLLGELEHPRDTGRIANDRYSIEGSPLDMAYRRGWNAGSRHVEMLDHLHRGLAELTANAPAPADLSAFFDLGGEG